MGEIKDREARPEGNRNRERVETGEQHREASRQRDLRDFNDAVNKGYRNRAITERLKQ